MVSLWGFTGLTALLALQRLWELRRSRHNEMMMEAQGGVEFYQQHYRLMIALHGSWFAAMLAEAWFFRTPPPVWLVIAAFSGLAAGLTLRYLAIQALGVRWSTRIYVVPDAPLIQHGIYRFMRHPNYLGVILEIACVPLLHAAYGTAFFWSLANLALLRHRIRLEEKALMNGGDS